MSLAGIAIAIGTMVDMAIIVSENIYGHLAEWEAEQELRRSKEVDDSPVKERDQVIYEAAVEVSPAVFTAVTTTIVSFLPVFFLTGRDYRLFSPLAYTKTLAIAAALIMAVTIVPSLSRLVLRSSRHSKLISFFSASSFAILLCVISHFLWGDRLANYFRVPLWSVTLAVGVSAFIIGWQLMRERILPLNEIPSSRLVHWVYAARLRYALNHKMIAMLFPAALLVMGCGAWVGLPTVLRPLERVARVFGAELNEFPGYVTAKHMFTGLRSDDWIALDEGSWFYMPTLYPAASFSQAMQVLQTQDVLIGVTQHGARVTSNIFKG